MSQQTIIEQTGLCWLNWVVLTANFANSGEPENCAVNPIAPPSPDITLGSGVLGRADAQSTSDTKSLFTGINPNYLGCFNPFGFKAFKISREIYRHGLLLPNSSVSGKANAFYPNRCCKANVWNQDNFVFSFLLPKVVSPLSPKVYSCAVQNMM